MPRCERCSAFVEDVVRHQRRSEYCRLAAVVQAVRAQGWRSVLRTVPTDAPQASQGVAVWPDARLACGPCDVQGGRWSRIRLVRGVLARSDGGFGARVEKALGAYVKERMLQDGGRIPFAHKSLRGYGFVARFQAETLWRWVVEGRLDERIEHYTSGDRYSDWWNVPDYLHDPRIECPHCGAMVKPNGLRAHQETLGCVGSRLNAEHWVIVGCLEDPELQQHAFWDALRRIGMEVGFARARWDRRRYHYVVTTESSLPLVRTVQLVLEHDERVRRDRAARWRTYAPYLGWTRAPAVVDLFDRRLVERPDLDVALSALAKLEPELVGVMAALG